MTKKAPQIADLSVRKEMISLMIGNYASILKIDEASISYDASLLERDKSILEGYRMNYLTLLSPLKRALVEKIFIRLDK